MPLLTVLYDASVLYPAPLRDLLMRLALARIGVGIGEAGATPPAHSLLFVAVAMNLLAAWFFWLTGKTLVKDLRAKEQLQKLGQEGIFALSQLEFSRRQNQYRENVEIQLTKTTPVQLSPQTTIIAPEKLREYALNFANRDGESKARFLEEMGYGQKNWQILEADLRAQHLSQEARPGKQSGYGEKYEIVAPLIGPNGEKRWLRSIWMIRNGESIARFITLIPEKQP